MVGVLSRSEQRNGKAARTRWTRVLVDASRHRSDLRRPPPSSGDNCNTAQHSGFGPQTLVLDITLCGDWALRGSLVQLTSLR
jgi:hypothetical protein